VKKNVEFIIPYEGLKNGKHEFAFQLGDEFFEAMSEPDFRDSSIAVKVELLKETTMLVFNVEHSGTVSVECDRCLNRYTQPVEGNNRLIVNFGDEYNDENETVLILPRSEYEIDLAPFIFEYITLSMPWKRQCAQDISGTKTCDEAMVTKLESLRAKNENKDTDEDDPRWDALRNLK